MKKLSACLGILLLSVSVEATSTELKNAYLGLSEAQCQDLANKRLSSAASLLKEVGEKAIINPKFQKEFAGRPMCLALESLYATTGLRAENAPMVIR